MATKTPTTRPATGAVARAAGAARSLHARNRLLTLGGWALTGALGFGVPIVIVLRLWLGAPWWWGVPLGLGAAAVLGAGAFVLARRWTLAHAAGEVDRANNTDGALRTALEIEDRDGEPVFVAMARRRGESVAAGVDPARAVPPARFEGWRWAAGAAAACLLAGLFVPQIERRDPAARAEVSPVVQRAAEQASTANAESQRVDESALPEPESWSRARAELEALEEELRRGDAGEDAPARTAAAMERAAEELERQNELAARREQELSDRAASFDPERQSRGDELTERLADALARNDLLRAEEIAREIDRTAPTLSEEERRELSDALEDLASRLQPDEPGPNEPGPNEPGPNEPDRDPTEGPRPEPTPPEPTPEDPSDPSPPAQTTADPTEPPPDEDPTRQDPDRPADPPTGDDPERSDQRSDDPRRDQQQDRQQQEQNQQSQQPEGQQQESQQPESQQQEGQQQEGQERPGGDDPQRPGEQPGDADAGERPGEEGARGERDPSRSVSDALRERARQLRDGSEQRPRTDPAQDADAPRPETGEGPAEASPESDQGREQPAERPDPDRPSQEEQRGREQAAEEQPDPDQPGEQHGEQPGEQPGEQGDQAPPGPLERAVRRVREQRDAREQNQRVAENLRQRARDLIEPGESAPGGPGDAETQTADRDADPGPAEFEPVDASGAPDPEAGSRVVGEWFDPDRTELPAAERRAAADELRRAAGRARDAVENQQVPRHRRELVQRVFERIGRRAEEVGSGSSVAPQGRDANP